MKIRRYMGKNIQEAMLKVKMDLGAEAIIMNTRKVRQKGLKKWFQKPLVEVLAAVDEVNASVAREKAMTSPGGNLSNLTHPIKNQEIPVEKEEKLTQLENKVNHMEGLLSRIWNQMQKTPSSKELELESRPAEYEKILELFQNKLLKNDVSPELVDKLSDMARNGMSSGAGVNDVASVLQKILGGILERPEPLAIKSNGKPTVALMIGPTGVGKTTTLAKIAANYSLNQKLKVAVITADTYRIAAVEQLKTYTEILDIPLEILYTPQEIKGAVQRFHDKDLVLVDTAGRSFRDRKQFEEVKQLVEAAEPDEIYLVLSATISWHNCKEILDNYKFLKEYKLIFTKLDEAASVGIILDAKHYTGHPLSYLTMGQNVPDDIEVANAGQLIKNLLGSMN